MKIDESNFVKHIKKKNEKALEFAVDNYSNIVFKIVRTVLNSTADTENVEECVSDVFMAVWNNINSFDTKKGNFKYWISAIAKYKAIDYKRKIFKQSKDECIDYYNLKDSINIENTIVSKENKQGLIELINTMSPQDKEIFIRRYFLDEDIENIARSFGVDRNLVDKRLSRGRNFLKKKLIILKGDVL